MMKQLMSIHREKLAFQHRQLKIQSNQTKIKMPDNVDVTKMKVADLKRELKLRGLPITGNKTELTERLQTALIDGEFALDDAVISGEDLLEDEDAVLTDEEAKILDENELLQSPGTLEKQHLADLLQEKDSGNGTSNTVAPSKKVVLKRKISTITIIDAVQQPTAGNIKENTAPIPAKILKSPIVDTLASSNSNKAEAEQHVSVSAANVKKIIQLTPQERLEMRAKKFGLNTVATNSSNTITASAENETVAKNNSSVAVSNGKEAELLKKRAERFGCVVSPKMAQLDVAERLQKRKERFGADNEKSSPIKSTIPTSSEWAEKARMRLERFKSTDANAAANTKTTPPTIA